MWKLMGNSSERVRVTDLGDVVYYRQIKNYSDQEYESSKDLQKAVKRGSLVIMDHTSNKGYPGSPHEGPAITSVSTPVDMEAIKRAVKEALPDNARMSLGESLKDLIPSLISMVRQEISSAMSSLKTAREEKLEPRTEFIGPEYVPTVTTEGMTSNISIEAQMSSGSGVSSNLELLRKLQQQQSK